MKVTFLSHAGFLLEGSKGSIIIDPFLNGNPLAVHKPTDLKADLILVTHGHGDHMGDAPEIAKNSGATIVGIAELARHCQNKGLKAHGMNLGGGYDLGIAHIKMTLAFHSGGSFNDPAEYLGSPCGFVITMDDKIIYHAGDTALFGDMELIGRQYRPNLALLPIGDNFTMGPEDAAAAVSLIKPNFVIPMHYNTFGLIKQDPNQFKTLVEEKNKTRVIILNPGDSWEL